MEMQHLIDQLHLTGASLVVAHGEETRTYHRRGVADLYDLYCGDPSFLRGAQAADKVVGKGAAALFALGGVCRLHADVVSTAALQVLKQAGIEVSVGQEVPYIVNRTNDGRCPLETLCDELDEPQAMLPVITRFVSVMRSASSNRNQ